MIACPSCGRADVDVIKLSNAVDELLKKVDKNIKVAVMGCEVNGPGEAKDAGRWNCRRSGSGHYLPQGAEGQGGAGGGHAVGADV